MTDCLCCELGSKVKDGKPLSVPRTVLWILEQVKDNGVELLVAHLCPEHAQLLNRMRYTWSQQDALVKQARSLLDEDP